MYSWRMLEGVSLHIWVILMRKNYSSFKLFRLSEHCEKDTFEIHFNEKTTTPCLHYPVFYIRNRDIEKIKPPWLVPTMNNFHIICHILHALNLDVGNSIKIECKLKIRDSHRNDGLFLTGCALNLRNLSVLNDSGTQHMRNCANPSKISLYLHCDHHK